MQSRPAVHKLQQIGVYKNNHNIMGKLYSVQRIKLNVNEPDY